MRGRIAHGLMIAFLIVGLGRLRAQTTRRPVQPQINQLKSSPKSATRPKSQPYQVGTASWYGEYFDGKTDSERRRL